MLRRCLLAATLLLAPLGAQAQDRGLYAGLQVGDYEFEIPPVTAGVENEEPGMIFGRLGYRTNRSFALEARYGESSTHDPVAALLGRFAVPFSATDLYLMIGVSEVRPNGFAIENEENAAFGIGFELYGTGDKSFGIEYMEYSNGALTGLGFGFSAQID